VSADDLVSNVPLEPLGARVPAQDVALRIESEDRVVLDALDQQPVELAYLMRDPTGGPLARGGTLIEGVRRRPLGAMSRRGRRWKLAI
jgi:hypothetical protein